MIAGNDERLALVIETQAKLEGIRAARAATSEFGGAVKQMATQAAASTTAVANSAKQVATEFNADIEALKLYGRQVDVTNKDAVAAFRQSVQAQIELGEETGASAAQLAKLDAMLRQVDRDAQQGASATAKSYDQINPRVKSAATSFALLSQAALTGQGSMAGLANAGALAAESLAMVSDSAKFTAMASGIGAAVIPLTIMAELYRKIGDRSREIEENDRRRALQNARTVMAQRVLLNELNTDITDRLTAQEGLASKLKATFDALAIVVAAKYGVSIGKINELLGQQTKLGEQMKDTRLSEARSAISQARDQAVASEALRGQLAMETTLADLRAKSQDSLSRQTVLQKLQIEAQFNDRNTEIAQRYQIRDADGEIVTLQRAQAELAKVREKGDDKEIANQSSIVRAVREQAELRLKLREEAEQARDAALAQNDAEAATTRALAIRAAQHALAQGDPGRDPYQDQVDEINELARKREDLIGKELAEAEALQKIRALQHARASEAVTLYSQMSKAAALHGSIVAKVASVAAKAIAIYEMIPQAKKDVQKGKSEFAAGLADFAVPGKQALGAAHMLASGAYFSSAAFGFAEAAGLGGNGGSVGSAGGGAAASGGTFEPADRSGGGDVTVILQTVDPTHQDVINEAIYQINRGGLLNKPVEKRFYGGRPTGMSHSVNGGHATVQTFSG